MGSIAIDSLPGFVAHLGKYRTDRIRYHQNGTGRRQPAAVNITNTVMAQLQDIPSVFGSPIEDILYGAAGASTSDRKPLSIQRLFNIFQCIPVINSNEIKRMMAIDNRQAQRYLRAAKLALPFIEKAIGQRPPDDI